MEKEDNEWKRLKPQGETLLDESTAEGSRRRIIYTLEVSHRNRSEATDANLQTSKAFKHNGLHREKVGLAQKDSGLMKLACTKVETTISTEEFSSLHQSYGCRMLYRSKKHGLR